MKVMIPNRTGSGREFPHTPVHFEMTDRSTAFDDSGCNTSRIGHYHSRPPKIDFPRFDGENPKWWKALCEKYFALYDVDHDTWANFVRMHFARNVAL
jgi:hypothetical protein